MLTRPYEWSDLAAVLAIETEAFRQPYPREYFTVRKKDRSLHVAEVEGGRVVGYAAVEFERSSAVLASLAVASTARGMGAGHNLLVAAFEECQRRLVRKLFLHVSVFNGTALGLYHKFGFRPVRWLPNYYVDEGEDAVLEIADVK
jgi:ribosomal-protein-alanine acetyltransferase